MSDTSLQITQGSGTRLHTQTKSVGGNTVHEEVFQWGENDVSAYNFSATGVATVTANSHLLAIMAGATLNVRIRRIRIIQRVAAAAATQVVFQVTRLTTAGTGGGGVSARDLNLVSATAGATAMTLPTAKGTESSQDLWFETLAFGAAANLPGMGYLFEWEQLPYSQPIVILAGVANGICLKNVTALATATVDINVEFAEYEL